MEIQSFIAILKNEPSALVKTHFPSHPPQQQSQTAVTHQGAVLALTCGVAGLGTKRQNFDIFVVGACSQQLPTMAPGNTVDGTFVMLVPLEAHRWLLDRTGPTEGRSGRRWIKFSSVVSQQVAQINKVCLKLLLPSQHFKFFTKRDKRSDLCFQSRVCVSVVD